MKLAEAYLQTLHPESMPPVPGAPAQLISVQIHAPPFIVLAIAYYRILYIALSRKSIVFRSPIGIVCHIGDTESVISDISSFFKHHKKTRPRRYESLLA